MAEDDLPSHFIDLVHDASLKSFWRKSALLNFLRRNKISENSLAARQESETKRIFVARLLPKPKARSKGAQRIKVPNKYALRSLPSWTPDLAWGIGD